MFIANVLTLKKLQRSDMFCAAPAELVL